MPGKERGSRANDCIKTCVEAELLLLLRRILCLTSVILAESLFAFFLSVPVDFGKSGMMSVTAVEWVSCANCGRVQDQRMKTVQQDSRLVGGLI